MKRQNLKTLILLLFMVTVFSCTFADDTELGDLNDGFDALYGTGDYFYDDTTYGAFNYTVYSAYQVPCYGLPHGDSKMVNGEVEPRFLGYTEFGESVPNPRFPYDSSTGKAFSAMHWYEKPWREDDVKNIPRFRNIKETPFDNEQLRPTFKESFLNAMQERYGMGDDPKFDIERDRNFPWERYYHIVLPPTNTTYGIALLFHRDNSGVWYLEVPLSPLGEVSGQLHISYCDLSGQPIADSEHISILAGQSHTATARTIDDYSYRGFGYSKHDKMPPRDSDANQKTVTYDGTTQHFSAYLVFYYQSNSVSDAGTGNGGTGHATITGNALDFKAPLAGDAQVELPAPLTVDATISGDITISSAIFDVERAIPTGEPVDITAQMSPSILFDYNAARVSGYKTYRVVVTKPYSYYWIENGIRQTAEDKSVTVYEVRRDYSYYALNAFYYYQLDSISVNNPKLSILDDVILTPASGQLDYPQLNHQSHANHLSDATLPGATFDPQTLTYWLTLGKSEYPKDNLPNFNFSNLADSALSQIEVRNDSLVFDGTTLLDDDWSVEQTAPPASAPTFLGLTLKRKDYVLSHQIANGRGETSGQIHYNLVASENFNTSIDDTSIGGNPMIIHTPVVNDTKLAIATQFDQRPDSSELQALPIDAVVALTINTSGQHIDAPGYGNRDYGKYVKHKRLYFPFDVYYSDDEMALNNDATRAQYLAKDSWQTLPADTTTLYIRVPHWQDLGAFTFKSEVVALNAAEPSSGEARANLNLLHDSASFEKNIAITGRLFDFIISGIDDRRWLDFFEQNSHTFFTIGSRNKNGQINQRSKAMGGSWPYTLPIVPGKQTLRGYQNVAIKLGYPMHFCVKSMGDYFTTDDLLGMHLSFHHIDADGNRTPIDLYYKDKHDSYIKFGHADDKRSYRAVAANQPLMKVNYIDNTANSMRALSSIVNIGSADSYLNKIYSNRDVCRASLAALDGNQRVYIGKAENLPNGVNPERARAAVQMWFGSYLLPNSTIAVPHGADWAAAYMRGEDITLKDGYIAIHADISLYKKSAPQHPILSFVTAHSNEWQVEGFSSTYSVGDIAYYHINQRASDDLKIK